MPQRELAKWARKVRAAKRAASRRAVRSGVRAGMGKAVGSKIVGSSWVRASIGRYALNDCTGRVSGPRNAGLATCMHPRTGVAASRVGRLANRMEGPGGGRVLPRQGYPDECIVMIGKSIERLPR